MGDLIEYRDRAIKLGAMACKLDEEKHYKAAFKKYIESIELFHHVIKCTPLQRLDEKSPTLVATLKSKVEEYFKRAASIKEYLKKKEAEPVASNGSGKEKYEECDGRSEDGKDGNKKLKEALSSAIVTEKPNVKWSDVAGLEKAKATLQEAVILPTKFPQLFVGKIRPWAGILLYGVCFRVIFDSRLELERAISPKLVPPKPMAPSSR